MVRHLLTAADLDRGSIDKILEYASLAENGNLSLQGKILGFLFLSESTRTSSSLKAAIIKAGGGWLGIEGKEGTYLKPKDIPVRESFIDAADSISMFADYLAVRGDVGPETLRHVPIPVLNAGLGDDHCLVATWLLYSLYKRFGRIDGLTIGVVGLARYSTPVKSVYRILANFKVRFYEDSSVDEAGTQLETIQTILINGASFEKSPIGSFIDSVDCLIMADCLGQEGDDKSIIQQFNDRFQPLTTRSLSGLKSQSVLIYFMPRLTTDGRLTVDKCLDTHPNLYNREFFRDGIFCNVGILAHLNP
ncbi:MAG TPA: hypothetical protein VFC63_12990 [Blastocatellia bacterium]|nr:hypothetical protein [Blastocatellia bacterium]